MDDLGCSLVVFAARERTTLFYLVPGWHEHLYKLWSANKIALALSSIVIRGL